MNYRSYTQLVSRWNRSKAVFIELAIARKFRVKTQESTTCFQLIIFKVPTHSSPEFKIKNPSLNFREPSLLLRSSSTFTCVSVYIYTPFPSMNHSTSSLAHLYDNLVILSPQTFPSSVPAFLARIQVAKLKTQEALVLWRQWVTFQATESYCYRK